MRNYIFTLISYRIESKRPNQIMSNKIGSYKYALFLIKSNEIFIKIWKFYRIESNLLENYDELNLQIKLLSLK